MLDRFQPYVLLAGHGDIYGTLGLDESELIVDTNDIDSLFDEMEESKIAEKRNLSSNVADESSENSTKENSKPNFFREPIVEAPVPCVRRQNTKPKKHPSSSKKIKSTVFGRPDMPVKEVTRRRTATRPSSDTAPKPQGWRQLEGLMLHDKSYNKPVRNRADAKNRSAAKAHREKLAESNDGPVMPVFKKS